MGATNLATKDDRILNINIAFRILTERIDYFLSNGIKNEYINEFRIIKNNCKIKIGNSKICIDVENKNNVNLVTNSIVKIFNNTYLYNKINDTFNRNIDARVVINTTLKKSKPLKSIRLTSSGSSVEISIIRQDSPLRGLPEILKPGRTNEAFLEILILEQFETIRELESEYGSIFPGAFKNPKLFLRLGISSTALYTTIGPILSASTVGGVRVRGLEQKPDVEIRTQNKVFKFSIKQNIFPEWSSAFTYEGSKAIIDYMQANNSLTISNNGDFIFEGISHRSLAFPATIGEIKKFCFNNDEIDFIIINTFNSNDIISNLTKADNNKYYIDVKCDAIYSNSMKGYRNLENNVYLVISKSNSGKTSRLMPGYRISFVPKNKLRGAHIINDSLDILGRL